AKSRQLTNAMVGRDCIRQSSKSGGRTLAKELVNKVIVALLLWKFDSGSRRLAVFGGIIEVSMQTPTVKPVCPGFSKGSCPRNGWDVLRRRRLGRYTPLFAARIQA